MFFVLQVQAQNVLFDETLRINELITFSRNGGGRSNHTNTSNRSWSSS